MYVDDDGSLMRTGHATSALEIYQSIIRFRHKNPFPPKVLCVAVCCAGQQNAKLFYFLHLLAVLKDERRILKQKEQTPKL